MCEREVWIFFEPLQLNASMSFMAFHIGLVSFQTTLVIGAETALQALSTMSVPCRQEFKTP